MEGSVRVIQFSLFHPAASLASRKSDTAVRTVCNF